MSGDEIATFVCKGNKDAEAFCKSFVAYCHLLDDCVDRDKPCDAERMAGESIDFILQLSGNPFYLAHKAQLIGLIIQGFRAWADSNKPKYNVPEMGCELVAEKLTHERDVIKGFYHEVVYHVAAILGGWEHLRKVTEMCREYDFEGAPKSINGRCYHCCCYASITYAGKRLCQNCFATVYGGINAGRPDLQAS